MASESNSLTTLASDRKIDLLNGIDKLRSYGISQLVSLPQLIVCGDQSSGKSSVLEAISGIPFPRKDNLCTRFATEVILRHAPQEAVSVRIVPNADRSEKEQAKMSKFKYDHVQLDNLGSLMDEARGCMGLDQASSSDFSRDILRLEISGPSQPHLTIVDLPGIIHSSNKGQTEQDVEVVNSMVGEYMKNERSIILAVVSAQNDYANQVILKRVREVDATGKRTLGVITKPDVPPRGSDSEATFVSLAKNEDVAFRLGWHVLRNRNYEERNTTSKERDQVEEKFFSQGLWRELDKYTVGISHLRERLSSVLFEQIRKELPGLMGDIEKKANSCRAILARLGPSRTSIVAQREFLLECSQDFQTITNAALAGFYGHEFFKGNPSESHSLRLRAIIQNMNTAFARKVRLHGHERRIVDAYYEEDDDTGNGHSISRSDMLEEIQELLKTSRGQELPGMYNPLLVGELFRQQSRPWGRLAQNHIREVWQAVKVFLDALVSHLMDDVTSEAVRSRMIAPQMDETYKAMTGKLEELLKPYFSMQPITYNHYFTDTIQKKKAERQEAYLTSKIGRVFDINPTDVLQTNKQWHVRPSTIFNVLSKKSEADMDRYACAEILDCMEAYYKVAMKSMIDNVAIYAIECCLMSAITDIFSPSSVSRMEQDLVEKIAAETPRNQSLRKETEQQLKALQAALDVCKVHASQLPSEIPRPVQEATTTPSDSTPDDQDESSAEEEEEGGEE